MHGQLVVRMYTEADIRRFYTYVSVGKPDECWEWFGDVVNGRAIFNFDNHQLIAARFCWWFTTGIWPGDLDVCHCCDNPICVNPAHLWLGTQKENTQDAKRKGRLVGCGTHGANHRGNYKLTVDEVRTIRARWAVGGVTQRQLAEEYGVCGGAMHNVIRRNAFKHVT